jgi:hypothetical protein
MVPAQQAPDFVRAHRVRSCIATFPRRLGKGQSGGPVDDRTISLRATG